MRDNSKNEGDATSLRTDEVLRISELTTTISSPKGSMKAVSDLSLSVRKGEIVAIVGESGSGKSITCKSIMGSIESPARIEDGRALFETRSGHVIDLFATSDKVLRDLRGNEVALIPQDPTSSLNPVLTIGTQLNEVAQRHLRVTRRAAQQISAEALRRVGISDPELRLKQYPHELSGGMRQRVLIGLALTCKPTLLIADEATTALDTTIQAQILQLINKLRGNSDAMGVLFVTHDMGVAAEVGDRVVVMYAGRIVESGPAREVLSSPLHPYTIGLLGSTPKAEFDMQGTSLRKRIDTIPGMAPDPYALPAGCAFSPRCSFAEPQCREAVPKLSSLPGQRQISCIRWQEIAE